MLVITVAAGTAAMPHLLQHFATGKSYAFQRFVFRIRTPNSFRVDTHKCAQTLTSAVFHLIDSTLFFFFDRSTMALHALISGYINL